MSSCPAARGPGNVGARGGLCSGGPNLFPPRLSKSRGSPSQERRGFHPDRGDGSWPLQSQERGKVMNPTSWMSGSFLCLLLSPVCPCDLLCFKLLYLMQSFQRVYVTEIDTPCGPKSPFPCSVCRLCDASYFSVGNGGEVLGRSPRKRVMNTLCSGIILPVTSSFYFMSSFVSFPRLHSSLSYK